jgi:hypothetical protein
MLIARMVHMMFSFDTIQPNTAPKNPNPPTRLQTTCSGHLTKNRSMTATLTTTDSTPPMMLGKREGKNNQILGQGKIAISEVKIYITTGHLVPHCY